MNNLCRVSLDEIKHDCPLYDESVAQHRELQMRLLTGETIDGYSLQDRFADSGEQRVMDRYLKRGEYASLVEREASILASIIMG